MGQFIGKHLNDLADVNIAKTGDVDHQVRNRRKKFADIRTGRCCSRGELDQGFRKLE